jgi:energy-coupling factor transporter ATP-binding protein EcfA2
MSTGDTPAKLRLLKLAVRDFRGIVKLDLDFTVADGEPLDVIALAGGNGCGKTAVLEAIVLALGRPDLLPGDAAPVREQIRFGAAAFDLAADLRFTRGIGPQLTLYPDIPSQEDFRTTLTVGFATPERSNEFSTRPDGVQVERLSGWGCSASGIFWPSVEYFSARREPEALGETPDQRGARSLAETRRIRELKRRLISARYRDLLAAPARRPGPRGPFARIQRFWERLNSDGRVLDVLPVDNDPGSGEEVILRKPGVIPEDITSLAMARQLAPSRSDIPSMVPLDRLSSGQMAIFAFAGAIVFRDQPADIVLIDEPEQHLHVQWQRFLLDALRELSPSTLFIVATHSEEILDSVLSYERFILVDDSDPRARKDDAAPMAEESAQA